MLVREILKEKGTEVYSISPEKTVYDAISKMDELDIGALVVVKNNKLHGIISERDYRSKVILKGRSSKNTPVREIMEEEVLYVSPEHPVSECMAIMTNEKVRHLPVMIGESLEGVISIGDIVKSIISDQKEEIKDLRHYIQGQRSYPA